MTITYQSKTGETTIKLSEEESRQFLVSSKAVTQVRKGIAGAKYMVVPYVKPTPPISNIQLRHLSSARAKCIDHFNGGKD